MVQSRGPALTCPVRTMILALPWDGTGGSNSHDPSPSSWSAAAAPPSPTAGIRCNIKFNLTLNWPAALAEEQSYAFSP